MNAAKAMRAGGVFIAGTDTGVGKTRVTVGLIGALRAVGMRATGMKPVATGTIARDNGVINEDVAKIAEIGASSAKLADINPYCFDWPVSPHIAAETGGKIIDLDHIVRAYERLARDHDIVVVEGTGGWLAPIGPDTTMADVARVLRLPVLLVVGLRLGCLNHALLTARAIASDGVALHGWIASVLDPQMQALTQNIEALDLRLTAPRVALLAHVSDPARDVAPLTAAAHGLMASCATAHVAAPRAAAAPAASENSGASGNSVS